MPDETVIDGEIVAFDGGGNRSSKRDVRRRDVNQVCVIPEFGKPFGINARCGPQKLMLFKWPLNQRTAAGDAGADVTMLHLGIHGVNLRRIRPDGVFADDNYCSSGQYTL